MDHRPDPREPGPRASGVASLSRRQLLTGATLAALLPSSPTLLAQGVETWPSGRPRAWHLTATRCGSASLPDVPTFDDLGF